MVKANVPEGKTYCSLCSRLRRGVLYNAADELGCTKIALGHHRDDAIETLLLNLMFSGQLKSMPPKLLSDDGRNTVIRPLLYSAESHHRRAGRADAVPDSALRSVRLAGQPQAQAGQAPARRPGADRHRAPRRACWPRCATCAPSHLLDAGLWQKLGLHLAPERGDALGEGLEALAETARVALDQPVSARAPEDALRLPLKQGRSLRVL